MKRLFLFVMTACLGLAAQAAPNPNIIYIFADDMGYGDVHVLNPDRCKIATPHMDRLAAEGMIFTPARTIGSGYCAWTQYGWYGGQE